MATKKAYKVDAAAYDAILAEYRRRHYKAAGSSEKVFLAGAVYGLELAIDAVKRVNAVTRGLT